MRSLVTDVVCVEGSSFAADAAELERLRSELGLRVHVLPADSSAPLPTAALTQTTSKRFPAAKFTSYDPEALAGSILDMAMASSSSSSSSSSSVSSTAGALQLD